MKMFKFPLILKIMLMLIVLAIPAQLYAQAIGASGSLKWLRVNSLHTYFSEQGAESETGGTEENNITFSWPAEYGLDQYTMRANGMWLGCKNYYDSKVDRTFENMVTNVGMKPNEYEERPIFDAVEFKLVGKFDHPLVVVDDNIACDTKLYDALDELNFELPADRMLLIKNHTSIGVTVTKRIYAFTASQHDNYYIYDYTLTNSGIIDNDGTVNEQTIQDLMFLLANRYALAGESTQIENSWGQSNSQWGRNTVNDVIGTDPEATDFEFRAQLAWYGPHSGQPIEDDWGCPNYLDDGIMAAAKYAGTVVLHADKSASDASDDPTQPRTTHYVDTDADYMQRAASQYDEVIMRQRYEVMMMGHADRTQAEEIELSGQSADQWGSGIGGTTSIQSYGPYTLQPGDSVHIVIAGGVAGLDRASNRQIGGNWIQWRNGTGNPSLVLPDGTTTNDYDAYKREWVWTCRDSLMQTFRNAIANYNSGYNLPLPPPPPSNFTVTSGGDRIILNWANNATSHPNFDGYVIYRAEGNITLPKTVYKKIFECNAGDVVHQFDDITATRGFDYYYYIQSKDDGSTNSINPGTPLKSGMFWTLTNEPAYLKRPAGERLADIRVVPNPYDIRARSLQFGEVSQVDRLAFYELPPECTIKIYTERGDLIWECEHVDGSGDETWDSITSSGQIIVSGIYIAVFETPTGDVAFRKFVVIR